MNRGQQILLPISWGEREVGEAVDRGALEPPLIRAPRAGSWRDTMQITGAAFQEYGLFTFGGAARVTGAGDPRMRFGRR